MRAVPFKDFPTMRQIKAEKPEDYAVIFANVPDDVLDALEAKNNDRRLFVDWVNDSLWKEKLTDAVNFAVYKYGEIFAQRIANTDALIDAMMSDTTTTTEFPAPNGIVASGSPGGVRGQVQVQGAAGTNPERLRFLQSELTDAVVDYVEQFANLFLGVLE